MPLKPCPTRTRVTLARPLKEPQSCPTCHITKRPPQPPESPGEHREREHRERGHPQPPHTGGVSTAPQVREDPPHRRGEGVTTASQRGRGTPRAEGPPGSGNARSSQSRRAGRSGTAEGAGDGDSGRAGCPPLTRPAMLPQRRPTALPAAARGRCSAGAAPLRGGASGSGRPRPLRDSAFPLVSPPAAQGTERRITERPAHRPGGEGQDVVLSVIGRAATIGR